MYRDTAKVERVMYYYTGSNWSHRKCNKWFKRQIWKLYQENIPQIHHKRRLY